MFDSLLTYLAWLFTCGCDAARSCENATNTSPYTVTVLDLTSGRVAESGECPSETGASILWGRALQQSSLRPENIMKLMSTDAAPAAKGMKRPRAPGSLSPPVKAKKPGSEQPNLRQDTSECGCPLGFPCGLCPGGFGTFGGQICSACPKGKSSAPGSSTCDGEHFGPKTDACMCVLGCCDIYTGEKRLHLLCLCWVLFHPYYSCHQASTQFPHVPSPAVVACCCSGCCWGCRAFCSL